MTEERQSVGNGPIGPAADAIRRRRTFYAESDTGVQFDDFVLDGVKQDHTQYTGAVKNPTSGDASEADGKLKLGKGRVCLLGERSARLAPKSKEAPDEDQASH